MPRPLLWLLLLAILAGGAYAFTKERRTIITGSDHPEASPTSKGVVLGAAQSMIEAAKEKVSDLAASIVPDGLKDIATDPGAVVKEEAASVGNNLMENALENAKQQIAKILNIGTTTPTEALPPPVDICYLAKENVAVSYQLGPLPSRKAFTAEISWGDGKTENKAVAADSKTTVSHAYAKIGNYVAEFRIASGAETVILERKICIN